VRYADIWKSGAKNMLHFVAADLNMGAGFAKQVVAKCGRPQYEGVPVLGDVILQSAGPFNIMHCVTKVRSSTPGNATYATYIKSARDAVTTCAEQGYSQIFVPYLPGCGLDRMPGSVMEEMFERIGREHGVEFVACKLPPTQGINHDN